MKKILLLGGSAFILPVIDAIHELGHYAITCDYLPDNIAHKYSDEYHNVSIIDKEAVLELAKRLKVDGIMSFACDPGVETAAYVAEKLSLPTHPYESVRILQNKALFRSFLKEHGFNVPMARGYSFYEDVLKDIGLFRFPIIVKPTDSAGSKGVTRLDNVLGLDSAINYAKSFSKTKTFIVEEFIEKVGCSSDTDSFSINGKLVYCSFNNQYFDKNANNPYTPSAYGWPSGMPLQTQVELRQELQRLFDLLNLKSSVFNIETRLGVDGKAYIMEVSPRGGGNRLSEVLKMATGVDLIANAVRASIGEEIVGIDGDPQYDGFWAEIILHADKEGSFVGLDIDKDFENKCVIEKQLWVKEGEIVHGFSGANFAIGTIVLKFANKFNMEDCLDNIQKYIKVCVE